MTTLANGSLLTKLDPSQAYSQFQVVDSSTPFVKFKTHEGLYQCMQLPFEVTSAKAMFKKLMDTVVLRTPGVICYIDDILVTVATQSNHQQSLEEVFQRLGRLSFRIKKGKCTFLANSAEYLYNQIDCKGIRALPSYAKAIVNAPTVTNVHQLRSFLGLLKYYGKFIKNLSSIICLINTLLQAKARLRKKEKWYHSLKKKEKWFHSF